MKNFAKFTLWTGVLLTASVQAKGWTYDDFRAW